MKNVHLITQEKYNNPAAFEKVAEGIYKFLFDYEDGMVQKGQYVTSIAFTLEEELNETADRQYPLEDLLDKFFAHVSECIQDELDNPVLKLELCTQGWLDKMEALVTIEGKHIYNKTVVRDGKTYSALVIE